MDWHFEPVAGPFGGTAEGPVWNGKTLVFTHLTSSRIMQYDPATGFCGELHRETHGANGLAYAHDGRLYGCQALQHCIARFDADGVVKQLPNRLQGLRHNRPNDLA